MAFHVSRGATCCARNRHQTWTNVVLAQVRVPYYACVSLYDAKTITCGHGVPRLSLRVPYTWMYGEYRDAEEKREAAADERKKKAKL